MVRRDTQPMEEGEAKGINKYVEDYPHHLKNAERDRAAIHCLAFVLRGRQPPKDIAPMGKGWAKRG